MRGDEDQGTSETNQMITYNYPDQAQHQDLIGNYSGRVVDPDRRRGVENVVDGIINKETNIGPPDTDVSSPFTSAFSNGFLGSKTGDLKVKPPTNAAPTNPGFMTSPQGIPSPELSRRPSGSGDFGVKPPTNAASTNPGFMTSPQGVPSPKSTKTNAKPPKQKPKVIENPDEIEPPPYEPPTLNKGNFLSPKYSSENAALSKNPNTLFSNPSLSLRDQYAANRKSSNPNVVRRQEIVDRENAEAEANKQTGTNGRNIGDMRKENEQYAQAAKNRGEPPIGSAEWVTWNRAKNQKRLDDAGINQTVDQVTHPFPTKTPNIKNENGVYYDQRDIVPGSPQDLQRRQSPPTPRAVPQQEQEKDPDYVPFSKTPEGIRRGKLTPDQRDEEDKKWRDDRDIKIAKENGRRSEANRQRKIDAKLRKGETLTDEEMSPPPKDLPKKTPVDPLTPLLKDPKEPLPVAKAAGDITAAEAMNKVMGGKPQTSSKDQQEILNQFMAANKQTTENQDKGKDAPLGVTDPRQLLAQAKQRKPQSNQTALAETYYNLRNKTLKEDIGEDIKDIGKGLVDYALLPPSMRNAAMRGEMGELGHTEKNAQEFNDHIASGMSNGLGLLTKFLPAAAMSKLNSLVGGIPGLELDVIIPRLATQMAHDFRSDPKPITNTLRDQYKANKEAEKAKALDLKKASTPSPTPTQTPTPTPTPTQNTDGKTYATNKKTPKFTIRPGISLA